MMRKPAIGFVLACVFLDALGIGLIVPVLPRLIGSLADTRDLQTSWYGAIMVSYGLMQFFFAPILGALSDRIGRRPVLLTGILGLSIMMIVPAVSQSLPFILLSRLVGGMMSSNIVVAQAYIADVTPSHQRIASFGKIGAIFGIAFVLGPAVGGVLGQTDPKIPFFVASAICALNFLYGFFILPESLRVRSTAPLSLGRLNPFSAIWSLAGNLSLRPLLVVITLFTLAQSLMQCTWALYTEFRYGWTPKMIGISIFVLGAAITVTQGWILPRLSARLTPTQLVFTGLFCGFAALIGIGFSTAGTFLLPLLALFSLMGVVGPTLQSVISRTGSPTTQGVRLGAASSLNSFTGAVSPLLGTPLLFFTSQSAPTDPSAGTPYFLAALLVLAAIILTLISPPSAEAGNTH